MDKIIPGVFEQKYVVKPLGDELGGRLRVFLSQLAAAGKQQPEQTDPKVCFFSGVQDCSIQHYERYDVEKCRQVVAEWTEQGGKNTVKAEIEGAGKEEIGIFRRTIDQIQQAAREQEKDTD